MKYTFSRYGGHGLIIGEGKASNSKLPEDQSLENLLGKFAFQMQGFTYLSSFQMLPEFMGAFEKLPYGAIKIADLNHIFTDVILQHDIPVDTKIYIIPTKYPNVFSCFINTNYKPLEIFLGKIVPSYDCVLIIRVQGKTDAELRKDLNKIAQVILGLVIFEMEIQYGEINLTPSNTHLGKKLDKDAIVKLVQRLKKVDSREKLAEIIKL